MPEKTGKLSVVAKTGGIQLEGEGKWINPAKTAKENILKNLEKLRSVRGKEVVLNMEADNVYKSIQIVEPEQKEEAQEEENQVTEERIADAEESAPEAKEKASEEQSEAKAIPKQEVQEKQPEKPKEEPEEECDCEVCTGEGNTPLEALKSVLSKVGQKFDKEYFNKLNKIECPTEKKNNLTYISWAHAWEKLKEQHPNATYKVHENRNGMPYFHDESGAFVKVSVTVCSVTHTVNLPVMDYNNNAMKQTQQTTKGRLVEPYTTFDINKSIQRALAKAIAMHGLGLYVYRGEDLPEERK